MLVGFARYSRDRSFRALAANREFVLVMAAGSIVGAFAGASLLGYVSATWLTPMPAAILVLSALKVWRHGQGLVPHCSEVSSAQVRGRPAGRLVRIGSWLIGRTSMHPRSALSAAALFDHSGLA